MELAPEPAEYVMGKEESACSQHFLLFSQCLQILLPLLNLE